MRDGSTSEGGGGSAGGSGTAGADGMMGALRRVQAALARLERFLAAAPGTPARTRTRPRKTNSGCPPAEADAPAKSAVRVERLWSIRVARSLARADVARAAEASGKRGWVDESAHDARLVAGVALSGFALAQTGCSTKPTASSVTKTRRWTRTRRADTKPPPIIGTSEDAAVDDGCGADTTSDPENCGACGVVCERYGALPKCTTGKCEFQCAPGLLDIDGKPDNGCEYGCSPSNGGVEICDGIDNNCDGVVDEGTVTNTDVNNCGACGEHCVFSNAQTVACEAGVCKLKTCLPGFANNPKTPEVDCDYACTISNNGVEAVTAKITIATGKSTTGSTPVRILTIAAVAATRVSENPERATLVFGRRLRNSRAFACPAIWTRT